MSTEIARDSELPEVATSADLAKFLGTTTAALANERYRGRGVPYVKLGASVRYLRADVLDHLAKRRVTTGLAGHGEL